MLPRPMPSGLRLFTCSLAGGGPKFHPCRRCHEALGDAGHAHEIIVFDRHRPMALFIKGNRPRPNELTGQEKLPVLQAPAGEFITGAKNIIEWAKSNPRAAEA